MKLIYFLLFQLSFLPMIYSAPYNPEVPDQEISTEATAFIGQVIERNSKKDHAGALELMESLRTSNSKLSDSDQLILDQLSMAQHLQLNEWPKAIDTGLNSLVNYKERNSRTDTRFYASYYCRHKRGF